MPTNFLSCPCTVSWLGRVAPLGRNSPLPILGQRHPRAPHRLRAYQLPKHWGVPSLATPPQRSRGRLSPQAPFRGSPVPSHCPRGLWRPGPRISGSPVPTTYPGAPWALGLPRPTSPVHPLSDTHLSQPRSQPVNRAPAPLQMGSSLLPHQQQNDFHFVNLTIPLTQL